MNTKKELKRSIVFVVLALSLLFFAVPMASASDWGYKKAIEIDHNKVAATLTNFPVLINSPLDYDLATHAQDDGDDIAFFDCSGTTQLAHEIEYFNCATGELQAWVKVPTLSSATNTTIYMYYGNTTCESQENVEAVWDSNFKMVQHLQETSGAHSDSTANNNDGTPHGGNLTQDATGKMGGADEFHTNISDDYGDYINCGSDSSLNITGDITIEAWVKNREKWSQSVVARHSMINPWDGYSFGISIIYSQPEKEEPGKAAYWSSKHGKWVFETVDERLDDFEELPLVWHHIAVSVSGTTGDFYRDGVSSGTVTTNVPDPFDGDCVIGAITDESYRFFNGTIDEVRISSTARSAEWINTSYNNQNDPRKFYFLGQEESTNDQPIPEFPTMSLPILITIAAVFLMYRRRQRQ